MSLCLCKGDCNRLAFRRETQLFLSHHHTSASNQPATKAFIYLCGCGHWTTVYVRRRVSRKFVRARFVGACHAPTTRSSTPPNDLYRWSSARQSHSNTTTTATGRHALARLPTDGVFVYVCGVCVCFQPICSLSPQRITLFTVKSIPRRPRTRRSKNKPLAEIHTPPTHTQRTVTTSVPSIARLSSVKTCVGACA